MGLRRRSVRLRVALLVVVPLVFLVAFFAYAVSSPVRSAVTFTQSKVMMDKLGRPTADLQGAISEERRQAIEYYARPTPARLATLEARQAATDQALAAFKDAAASSSVRQSASAGGKKAIAALLADSGRLPALRTKIPTRTVSEHQLFSTYNTLIAASYQVLEQAILQEGNSSQVLPGIAVIELAVSGEYVQQESALLNGDLVARSFPSGDHRTFVSLVGAHRLLYAQSIPYLDPADRASLSHDLHPQTVKALTALENTIAAQGSPAKAPPVRAATWNATVTAFSTQIQRAVGQAEARLAQGARSQANGKLRTLYMAAGLGLAAVVLSVIFSLWIAAGLARQLAGLRDSALELANTQLPDVVRRLRGGEDVDVASEVPALDAGEDEIGQVKAAFNNARRTAVEAAVDEAKVRRGINDVFRNLARRSQSLLHRQMALLDAQEKRESDPDSLGGLYRIDHLTTRMRRHAESLIILAGDSPRRSWRNPVPFVDVLRAAAAEVEDYTRIKVITSAQAALAGHAVADVIHMIAEFVENATLFSPQTTPVRITGEPVATGFAVEIEDRGLGLSDQSLATLNATLADPPPFDLSGSDQLGIFVAAQLAKRHGIQASLARSPYGGVTAVVLIPQALVVSLDADDPDDIPALSPAGRLSLAGRHAVVLEQPIGAPPGNAYHDPPLTGIWAPAAGDRPAALTTPARDIALPERASASDGSGRASGAGAAAPGGDVWDRPAQPADGQRPGANRSGPPGSALPQRIRQASLAPQLRAQFSASQAAGDQTPRVREPEVARRVMSAFQRGWRDATADPSTAPHRSMGLAQEGDEDE